MPHFIVKLAFSGSAEQMEGARVALQVRLPDLQVPSGDLREACVMVTALDSTEAVKGIAAKIDSLPPDVADHVRLSAEPAT